MSQNRPGLTLHSPRRGEVYWVVIPKQQTEGSEHRDTDEGNPHAYVIVSRDAVNDRLNSFVGVPLSSRLHKANKSFRPLIKATDILPDPGHEVKDCVALCDHIREIAPQRFTGKLGKATITAMAKIDLAIAFLLSTDD